MEKRTDKAATAVRGRDAVHAALSSEAERRRLVRLCGAITGDGDAAEDLAQETLLEAWRNAHKLSDPVGVEPWLNAITRNVCLRWRRSRGRDLERVGAAAEAARVASDLEAALEDGELEQLLDRALGLLPPESRDVLVQRYVDERSPAEIGEQLRLSEDAVSMRLTRGKRALRQLLGSELRHEAAAHGLAPVGEDWRETRVWCAECGRRRLLVRAERAPGAISFRCPGCEPLERDPSSEFRLANPFFANLLGGLVRPTAIVARTAAWSRDYFAPGANGEAACTGCGKPLRLRRYAREGTRHRHGLFARCDACGEEVSSSIGGLAVAQPELRALQREHGRTRRLPEREVDHGGIPALVVRYEDTLGSSGVDVLFARDSLRVLDVLAA
jgi:RNA polymerase sigma-70 factor (ECF subfamily)